MQSKKILITGASGFLGSWVARELIRQGHDLSVLHRKGSDLSELEGLKYTSCLGDVTDFASVEAACEGKEVVYHLAGVIGYSKDLRPLMDKVNVGGTGNIVKACLQQKVQRLIYMSSVVAIGASFDGKIPLNESSHYNLKSLNLGYFETKRIAEELVVNAHKEKGLEAIILNPSTVYGPGDAKKGSRKTQLKVARGEFPFYTSGGVNIIHVKDLVSAAIHAMEMGKPGERYILGGENILIKDLFRMIAEAAGVKPPRIHLPNAILHGMGAVGDFLKRFGLRGPISSENAWTSTMYHWFDSTKAQKELGLTITPALQSIADSVGWSREHGLLS